MAGFGLRFNMTRNAGGSQPTPKAYPGIPFIQPGMRGGGVSSPPPPPQPQAPPQEQSSLSYAPPSRGANFGGTGGGFNDLFALFQRLFRGFR